MTNIVQRIVRSAACLAMLALLGQSESRAAFSYVTTPTTTLNSGALGGWTILTTGVSNVTTLTTPTLINIANIFDTSTTVPPATDAFTLNFNDVVQITNIPPPGSAAVGSITVTGQLQFTRNDNGGEVSTFTAAPASYSTTIGGVTYTLTNFTYSADGERGNPGNISAPDHLQRSARAGLAGDAGAGPGRGRAGLGPPSAAR